MPIRRRPLQAGVTLLVLNGLLLSTISPTYEFVCALPYWERRREQRRKEHENVAQWLTGKDASQQEEHNTMKAHG